MSSALSESSSESSSRLIRRVSEEDGSSLKSSFEVGYAFVVVWIPESESLSNSAIMALILCPGVSIIGELPAEDAERVDRGVEGEDISKAIAGVCAIEMSLRKFQETNQVIPG